jgi:D-glycerate 3-kinase
VSEEPLFRLLRGCGIEDGETWRLHWGQRLRDWPAERGPLPLPDTELLFQFALPLLERLRHRAVAGGRPVLFLNAPVGAGKTSLARLLHALAPGLGLRLAVASIDDAYLPWRQRLQAMAGNPFGVTRVPPGSHDPHLLCRRIDRWRAGDSLHLPRFDKTLRQGEGDRHGSVSPQADALLLEGWLLGCRPLGSGLAAGLERLDGWQGPSDLRLKASERAWLSHWDQALQAYQPLWSRCDGLWLLRPRCWSQPRRWRFQAEARQRRRGGAVLPVAALGQLVRASLCSLPPLLYQEPLLQQAEAAATLDGRRRLVELAVSLHA